jgi:bacterial/archaeal transporter family-2 protein
MPEKKREASMWGIVAGVVLIGTLIALQPPVNAAVRRELGGPIPAALVAFSVGFAVLAIIAVVQGHSVVITDLPEVPTWTLICGCFAAWIVLSAVWGVSSLGILSLVAALVLGQMTAALVVDATLALDVTAREITPNRIAAAGLVMAAVILTRA